jgi:hypothetical protein
MWVEASVKKPLPISSILQMETEAWTKGQEYLLNYVALHTT